VEAGPRRSCTGRETEIQVGHIRAIGKHKGWMVCWDPATDTGRRRRVRGYDWRA
jgi:hypothetical protein